MKSCPVCAKSGRPGYVVISAFFDRMVKDSNGDMHLTSGKDYARCLSCAGTATVPDDFEENKNDE